MASESVGHASDLYSFSEIPTGNRAVPSDEEENPSGTPGKEPGNYRYPVPGRPRPGLPVEASRRLPRIPSLATPRLAGITTLQVMNPQRA
jgi:hypothetical protein